MSTHQVVEGIPASAQYRDSWLVDTAHHGGLYREFGPLSTLNFHDRTQVEFEVPGAPDMHVDLFNSKLVIGCKITAADGTTALTAANIASFTNLLPHMMWESMDLFVNGRQVTETSSNYGAKAYMQYLMTYDKNTMEMRGEMEGWCKDAPGAMNNPVQPADHPPPIPAATRTRAGWSSASREMLFVIRPFVDLFHQPKYLPPGVSLRLRLTPAHEEYFMLQAAAGDLWRLVLTKCRFMVRCERLSPSVQLDNTKHLTHAMDEVPYMRTEIKQYHIPAATQQYPIENVYNRAVLPERVLVALVEEVSHQGTRNTNPLRFTHFGLSKIGLKVNGEYVDGAPLEMAWTNDTYKVAFWHTLDALGLDNGDKAVDWCAADYRDGFTIFAFKVAYGPHGDPGGPITLMPAPRGGSVQLELQFGVALPNNVIALVYCESRDVLRIDGRGNVVV